MRTVKVCFLVLCVQVADVCQFVMHCLRLSFPAVMHVGHATKIYVWCGVRGEVCCCFGWFGSMNPRVWQADVN